MGAFVEASFDADPRREARAAYVDGSGGCTELLRSRGFDERTLRAVIEPGGAHHETDWARRLPDALRVLLG